MLKKIVAHRVLGAFNYNINFSESESDIFAIYAPNGSGKTNFLKLVTLVSNCNLDSMQEIFKIPFEEVIIESSKGTVYVEKVNGIFSEEVQVSVNPVFTQENDNSKKVAKFTINEIDLLRNSPFYREEDDLTGEIFQQVREIAGNFNFLGTDRIAQSEESVYVDTAEMRLQLNRGVKLRNLSKGKNYGNTFSVLDDLDKKLVRQALSGSVITKRDGVYAEITRKVLNDSDQFKDKSAGQASSILAGKIQQIDGNNKLVKKYEIVNFDEYDSIKKLMQSAPRRDASEFKQLIYVLAPYLDSLNERINIARDSAEMIDTFIKSLNGLLENKTIDFKPSSGFSLKTKRGESLSFSNLSSGEKHLVLILANAIYSSAMNDDIIIIDEPEISLGIRWQRNLLKKIIDCTEKSNTKILFASHSPLMLKGMNRKYIIEPKFENNL